MSSNQNKILRPFLISLVSFATGFAICFAFFGLTSTPDDEEKRVQKKEIVMEVGNSKISIDEVEAHFGQSVKRFASEEQIKQRLDEIVTLELLYQEAIKKGFDEEPSVKKNIQQILAQKLLNHHTEEQLKQNPIGISEIKAFYEQNNHLFKRDKQVRLATIFIKASDQLEPKERDEKKKKALQILKEVELIKRKRSGFGALVRKYSDKHPHYSLGDTGYFSADGNPIKVGKNVADAAFQLTRIGQTHESIINSPEGFHIVMLTGRRPAMHRRLETVKRQIKQKLQNQQSVQAKSDLIASLKDKTKISIVDELPDQLFSKFAESNPRQKQGPPPIPSSGG